MLAALAGSDRKAALALVTDLMSIAGTTNVGGRSVSEIADRFLEQSTLKGGALPRDALDRSSASSRSRAIPTMRWRNCARWPATPSSTSRPRSISSKAASASWPRAASIPATTRFSTSFGRGLDYYTGFEFELHAKGNGVEPLVAGGRYDGLMTQLGAARRSRRSDFRSGSKP